ncbi:MAG: bifunctional (p)ppGpp synthetase/guanosine-3',5'-bis(diphosphate) 3'-pyrophosphohydrolase [Sulfuricellaceae bacterium]|nr:bifunctional (p)ppGpp synthetase/guanosine-3',5'-bis(diphosphate) 3'-pyrophosphohydrolase [Sulfuricellaceae bacterium]
MVTVTNKHHNAGLDIWMAAMATYFSGVDLEKLGQAAEMASELYADQLTPTGVPWLDHALGAASILATQNMDVESVVAAVLQAAIELAPDKAEQIGAAFGASVPGLIDGVTRMGLMREASAQALGGRDKKDNSAQIEALRKMMLAMVEDIRVVLIKLAERTQAMRELPGMDESLRRQIAQETRDIFAPLANRLGVWQVKWELEDLSFRFLEPELYKKIAKLLDEKRLDRESYIQAVMENLRVELEKNGVKADISGRPKHINSIYKKMKRKKVDFSEVYDVRAVRVLVSEVRDCYTALGVVHGLWQPIPSEFDDYIAHPKGNHYRSLHTAVIGPEDKALEVQIRTQDMHNHAELGVAAHWRYKEGGKGDARFEEKIAWLRQLMEWKDDVEDAGELMEQFKTSLFVETIYVLTPQGRVIALPQGATPVDFAYHVHTDQGHRCRGAKVDGAIVPLSYKLQNGQRVEVITVKQGGPSRDWLSPALGFAASTRTRTKIRHWFNIQHQEESIADGRAALEKEVHRLGVAFPNLEKLAQKTGHDKPDDMFAAIGRNQVTAREIMAGFTSDNQPKAPEPEWQLSSRAVASSTSGVLIDGVGDLMTVMAKCCKPVPPDPIIGFVTTGRGVAIHRRDCSNILHMPERKQERLLPASWSSKTGSGYEVDVELEACDRQGLLRDISDVMMREKANVTAVNTQSRGDQAYMGFTVQVSGSEQLARILSLVREVPGVIHARRK